MPKKQQKEPFLHIQQTGIKPPVGHMQEIYISRIADKEKKEQLTDEKKVVQSEGKEEQVKISIEKVTEGIEDKIEERKQNPSPISKHEERKPGQSFQRLKSFKEMTIIERVNYLVEFPKQLAPVSCIFEAEEKTVRGILVGKSDDKTIDIRTQDGKITTIPIESLTDVKMIGLRR